MALRESSSEKSTLRVVLPRLHTGPLALHQVVVPAPDTSPILRDEERLAAVRCPGLLDGAVVPDVVLDRLTRYVASALNAPVALLSLLEQDRQSVLSASEIDESLGASRQIPIAQSVCKYTVALGKPVMLPDTRKHPWTQENEMLHTLGYAAYAGVPITSASGQAIGALCVYDTKARSWTSGEVRRLEELAEIAADMLERRSAIHMHGQVLGFSAAVLPLLLHPDGDAREVTQAVLAELGTRFGWDAVALWVREPKERLLICQESWSSGSPRATEIERRTRKLRLLPHTGIAGHVFSTKRPFWSADLRREQSVLHTEISLDMGIRSTLGFPVWAGDDVVAVVLCLHSEVRSQDATLFRAADMVGRAFGHIFVQQRNAAQLRASAAHHAAVLHVIPDALMTVDAQGIIREWNAGAEALFGYARAHVIGQKITYLIVPPALRAQFVASFARHATTGETRFLDRCVTVPALHASGAEILIEVMATRVVMEEPTLFTVHMRKASHHQEQPSA